MYMYHIDVIEHNNCQLRQLHQTNQWPKV